MPDIRPVTDAFAVAPQLRPEDMAGLAGRFTLIINNRDDGEETTQPSGAEIAQAAKAAGLAYTAIPVRGFPTEAQVRAVREAVQAADGAVLAFCRSGTRSIVAWAIGEALTGRPIGELRELGARAGYDLGPALNAIQT
jgi:uncharacterized protein (TIGR01244 family)